MATERTSPEIEAARDKIEAFRKEGCAIISYCNINQIPEFHKIEVIPIKIPAADVYKPSQSKGYTLHYRALVMLGNEIGVQWVSEGTKMTLVPGQYVQYDAVGFYRRSDGEPVLASGLGVKIYADEKETLLAGFVRKAKSENKPADWAEHKAQEAFFNDRKKYPQKAEAEAKAQVLRNLLRLSGSYAKEMFDKPIVLIRCKFVPDYSDPHTVRIMQFQSMEAGNSIYGQSNQALLPAPGDMPGNSHLITPDASAEIPEGMDLGDGDNGTQGSDGIPLDPPSGDTGEPSERPSNLVEFRQLSDDERRADLEESISDVGYEFQSGYSFENLKPKQYCQLFEILLAMDQEASDAGVDDDIPF